MTMMLVVMTSEVMLLPNVLIILQVDQESAAILVSYPQYSAKEYNTCLTNSTVVLLKIQKSANKRIKRVATVKLQ